MFGISFFGSDVWRRLIKNRLALIGLVIIILLILTALIGPLIIPYKKAITVDLEQAKRPPSLEHPLGTDDLGRNILARLIYGSQVSLEVGIIAIGIGLIIGLLMGALSGYFGGFLDTLIMRSADLFFAFPFILGAIVVMTVLGPGLINVFMAIGVLEWAYFARLFRGSVLKVKENQYVEAARALGVGNFQIILRHIFPNALAPVMVYAAMSVGGAILTEATLSFLGLGVQPPRPSWGQMLAQSQPFMGSAPWMMYFPGLALMLTVLGFIFLAEGLREALDPKLKPFKW